MRLTGVGLTGAGNPSLAVLGVQYGFCEVAMITVCTYKCECVLNKVNP